MLYCPLFVNWNIWTHVSTAAIGNWLAVGYREVVGCRNLIVRGGAKYGYRAVICTGRRFSEAVANQASRPQPLTRLMRFQKPGHFFRENSNFRYCHEGRRSSEGGVYVMEMFLLSSFFLGVEWNFRVGTIKMRIDLHSAGLSKLEKSSGIPPLWPFWR